MMLSKKEAEKRVHEIASEAQEKLNEAEKLADLYGVDFGFNPAYGMGGHYYPNPANAKSWPGSPEDYEFIEEKSDGEYGHAYGDYQEDDEGYWRSSSSSC